MEKKILYLKGGEQEKYIILVLIYKYQTCKFFQIICLVSKQAFKNMVDKA